MLLITDRDIANRQGYAEAYKDVIREDALKIGAATKAPDYCFRVGGARKFFVEAKKPSVYIKAELEPAFQLRRYAWSAKLPLSILTNFEEFAVYDCRIRPQATDGAAVARILYVTSSEYARRWNEIAEKFSHEAVLKGAFDRYAESTKVKRGTTGVDDAFLDEIETWRNLLAHDIALRNRRLTQAELNFAVQTTINRIIFLRICEDRGIEQYARLAVLPAEKKMYQRLLHYFQQADERYNSGLFHFRKEKGRPAPDELTPRLTIDNKPLKQIIQQLYYPESPYEFSVLPADILGQVYEQFLGKVIRLTAGHHAIVDEKPEVKKSGGVFYTPTFIVTCIVAWTIGKLIKGKTPHQVDALRILDLACGSGSFLIAAYQYLLDWYRDHYVQDGPEKHRKELYQGPGGDWRLTAIERKRILLNNIYGVDIDAQAVEVTKLSLLLKVLEGENEQSIGMSFKMFHERALPDLANNIKCGNSLIGPEFYREYAGLTDVDRARINAFDWTRGFPDVMTAGGFDIIIGNPPYIRIQVMQEWAPLDVEYYKRQYASAAKGNYDIYVVFIERALALLNRRGHLGFIVPNKFFTVDYGEPLRRLLGDGRHVEAIVHFGHCQVFERSTTYTCLLFLRQRGADSFTYATVNASPEALATVIPASRKSNELGPAAWTFEHPTETALLAKLLRGTRRLLDLPAQMSRGSSTGDDAVFVFEAGTIDIEAEILREPLFATDFGRYDFRPSRKWRIIFPYTHSSGGGFRLYTQGELKSQFPKAFAYLHKNMAALKKRKQYTRWFGYSAPRNLALHERAQIAVPLLADRGLFALIPADTRGRLCPMASGGFTITLSENCELRSEYILGLLNSKLLFWRLRPASNVFRGGWVTCTKQYFGELPVRVVSLSDPAGRSSHDGIVTLVERMQALRQATPQTPHEAERLERDITACDEEIDRLVYQLYEITDDERAIIDAALLRT